MNHTFLSLYTNYINNCNQSINDITTLLRNQQSTYDNLLRYYTLEYHNTHNNFENFSTYSPANNSYRPAMPIYRSVPINTPPPFNNIRVPFRENNNPTDFTSFINELNNFDNLEPVAVRPTHLQLHNNIQYCIFNEIESPLNYFCPISQIDFSANDNVIQLKSCNHIFSPHNILQWFETNVHCPLCRADIRDSSYNINTESELENPNVNNSSNRNTIITRNIVNRLNTAISNLLANRSISDISNSNLSIEVLFRN